LYTIINKEKHLIAAENTERWHLSE